MTDSRLTKEQTLDLDTFAGVDCPRRLRDAGYSYWRMQQPTTNAKAEPAPPPRRYFCAGYVLPSNLERADRVFVYRDPRSRRRSDARAIK